MSKTKHYFRGPDDLPAGLRGDDVAAYLGISRATAYNLLNSEGFPVIKIGKRSIVPKEAFLKWIENNTGKKVNIQEQVV